MKIAASSLDLQNYSQLARRMWPQTLGLAILDTEGELLNASDETTREQLESLPAWPADACLDENLLVPLKLASSKTALLIPLQNTAEMQIGFVAWVIEQDQSAAPVAEKNILDSLMPLCVCINNDISLNTELDSMAAELAGRYEELNLVYHTDDQVSFFREGEAALRNLVQNCADYLDVGLAVLHLRDKRVTAVSRSKGSEIDFDLLRRPIQEELYDRIVQSEHAVVVNDPLTEELPSADGPTQPLQSPAPYKLLGCPISGAGGQVDGILLMVNSLAAANFANSDKNLLAVMSKKAAKIIQGSYDGLTGLLNRASFEHMLESELKGMRHRQAQHCILHVNIDQLHRLNETLGHEAGDMVIMQTASTVISELRDSDTVARIGGDESGVLIRECATEQGQRIAKKLRKVIAGLDLRWGDTELKTTVSIGVAGLGTEDVSGEQAMKNAVVACEVAKEAGRNRVEIYELADSRLREREEHMWMVGTVQAALREGSFLLFGQTIQPLQPGGRAHLEVLLRMQEGDRVVSPSAFLPASERYQLMWEIDRWVIENTLVSLVQEFGATPDEMPVCGINVSGQSFGKDNFLEFVIDAVQRSRLPAESLCFEITETAAVANMTQAQNFIGTLREIGCTFALDDFGAGLSSFGYLRSFDVQYLKIDGALVRGIATDSISEAMVASVNQIGHVMGLQTIGEFVETPAVQAKLQKMGVDFAQGYAIAKPQPLAELCANLRPAQLAQAT